MRTHPPTLIKQVTAALEQHQLRGARLLVGVSGGPDSMALLHVLGLVRERLGLSVFAHGVDHGLRAEAAAELDLAEALAARHEVPFARTRIELAPGPNLLGRAREARYEVLERAALELQALVTTAHHADDRAETVLLRLLRGAGPQGLAVLPERSGAGEKARVRPMIRATRDDVERHVARHRLHVAQDPSNQDLRFLRVRVRRELMPLLKELSPGIVGHLTALADQLQEEGEPSGEAPGPLNRAQIAALQRALQRGSSAEVRVKGGRTLRLEAQAPVQGMRRGRIVTR
ncbi:MAG: tRNA lysidine(34) synthetase TilS [Polyangiaceae bacterium]|nr:tRNA lysidine(34) synthetase TilS [Polyangiaceae bacterium]MCW5789505.1 tRNA lysidine(34) synthetase TilS [Polyangiaceae bacterium]